MEVTCRCLMAIGLLVSFAGNAEVLSIAHRGNSVVAPENTVAAFAAALEHSDMVEVDVRVSSDGRLVVMHDSTVDRTTDGAGSVSGKTLAQLKTLDAGSWFAPRFAEQEVPTLEESLNAILPACTPLIEHKAGTAARYATELRRLGAITNVVVQSFDWNFLSELHALEPELRLCALGSGTFTESALETITNSGAGAVAWERASVGSAEASRVHAAGLQLLVWTVDGEEIRRFVELGVDGIISNDPARVRSITRPRPPGLMGGLRRGLAAYWPLDDGMGMPGATVVKDTRGLSPGVVTGGASGLAWGAGMALGFGGCFQAAGEEAGAEFAPTPELDINTNAVTISLWTKLNQLPSSVPESFAGLFDSVQDSYVLYLDRSARELRFKVTTENGQGARPGIGQASLTTNEWLHVVGTFNGAAAPNAGRAAIYLNGEMRDEHIGADGSTGTGLTGIVKPSQYAAIGHNGPQATYPFHGSVDDVAVWARALSAEEIRLVYETGKAGFSVGELFREASPAIRVEMCERVGNMVRIRFRAEGEWRAFKLLRSATIEGPYLEGPRLGPTAVSEGLYEFVYPVRGEMVREFLRVGADKW